MFNGEETQKNSRPTTLRELGDKYRGRVLRLKSGGPLMTVHQVVPPAFGRQLACSWFAEPSSTKLARAVFSSMRLNLPLTKSPSECTGGRLATHNKSDMSMEQA